MRYSFILLALAAAGCASTPEDEPRTAERCSAEECFRQRDIRRVEVLDDQNIVVFAGARECPFRVEVRGFACRLDFALDLNFVQRQPGSPITNTAERYRAPQRVCAFTPRVMVFTGVFDQARQQAVVDVDVDPPEQACQVIDVDSLTDDELVELYVDRNLVAPPPPLGGGRLETPEQDEDEADAGEAEPDDTASRDEETGAASEDEAAAPAGEGSAPPSGERAALPSEE